MNKIIQYIKPILLLIAITISVLVFANPTDTVAINSISTEVVAHEQGNHETAKPDPVEAIMAHIADANEYHIATIDGHHYSIPLPCAFYNFSTKKFSTFMSSKFRNGHEEAIVDGYTMDHHGKVTTEDNSKFINLSITKNVFTMLLGFIIATIVLFIAKAIAVKQKGKAPKGLLSVIEPVITYLREDIFIPNLGSKYVKFEPYLLSLFFFILINNLIGLIPFFPGGANVSGNISFTCTIAIFTFLMINLNGNKHYWKHVFWMPDVPAAVKFFILTPIEIAGLFIKPVALMLRLFGNITGGHIAILSIVSLIFIIGQMGDSIAGAFGGGVIAFPILIFVNAMELFVAFLQAYVFTLLSAIFIGMAIDDHGHAAGEHH